MEHFLTKLNRFIQYLQEKPESRSVEYLAEEKHPVKCCYRCGYVYGVRCRYAKRGGTEQSFSVTEIFA